MRLFVVQTTAIKENLWLALRQIHSPKETKAIHRGVEEALTKMLRWESEEDEIRLTKMLRWESEDDEIRLSRDGEAGLDLMRVEVVLDQDQRRDPKPVTKETPAHQHKDVTDVVIFTKEDALIATTLERSIQMLIYMGHGSNPTR